MGTIFSKNNHNKVSYTKLSTAILIENECSRKITNWDLLDLNTQITLPEIVEYYLENPHWYLAGGAVCDLYRGRTPNDYDLFYVNNDCDATAQLQKFLHTLRKVEYYETKNCISVKYNEIKLQFIKRVYNSPDQVIGGFDMEPSKFICKTKVQCTRGALLSCKYNFNPLNLYSQSESFTTRVIKYGRKGFIPYNIWDVKRQFKYSTKTKAPSDYGHGCYFLPDLEIYTKNTYILRNLCFVLQKKYEYLYSTGRQITEREFREFHDTYLNSIFGEKNYGEIAGAYSTREGGYYVVPLIYTKKYTSIIENSNKYKNSEDVSHAFFKKYNRLFRVMISNVHTQFTNSFCPTNYELNIFCRKYEPLKLYKNITIMCILRCALPKPLRYMILKYWAQTHLIQF